MSYKPDGYPDLSPYLVVGDAAATLAFVTAVFGTAPERVITTDDGAIVHAEIRVGDGLVMVGQTPGGTDALLHVYVTDPGATVARALEAGATEVEPVTDRDDGDRRGAVRDPGGTTWYLARASWA